VRIFSVLAIAAAAVSIAPTTSAGKSGSVTAHITGLRNSDGQVLCALFKGPKGFPNAEHATQGGTGKLAGGKATCRFSGLRSGRYAVAILHDEDADGEMDTVLGIPTEGFAFSNNAKPSLFGPPSFDEAAFQVAGDAKRIGVRMLYL
jgi:uncharacterized protein (DUF2141 family)